MRLATLALLTVPLTVTAIYAKQRPLSSQIQPPTNLGPAMPEPPSNAPSSPPSSSAPSNVILSDVLGNERSINIFAGFTRDFATINQRFEDSSLNTTILAPVNSAIMALPRKPWEDPKDYEDLGVQAYEGDDGQERAKGNMRRFVEAHVVPISPWKEGERVKTLAGGEVWWEVKEGLKMVS